MAALTPRQLAVLRAIDAGTEVVRRGPTVRQIGEATGLRSTQTVFRHLYRLRWMGLVEKAGNATLTEAGRLLLAKETSCE